MDAYKRALARTVFFLMVLGLCAPAAGTAADLSFAPGVDYSTGNLPTYLAVGDLNLDDRLDLAVSNAYGGSVTVFLGNGDGTFQPGIHRPTAQAFARCVAMGRLDEDSLPDLLVSTDFGSEVWLGNGDGTFQDATYLGFSGNQIVLEDLNGDDVLDVVSAVGDYALVKLGNGDGTFLPGVYYPAGLNSQSVAVGILNGDDHADLALANMDSNDVSVLLGNGDGTFQTAVNYPAGEHTTGVSIGDLNEDAAADLVAANEWDHNLSLLFGNGDGTFQPAVTLGSGALIPISVGVGDLDGDGHLDLMTGSYTSNTLSIFLGKGDGTFLAPVEVEGGDGPFFGIEVVDLNGDDKLDLVTSNLYGNSITVHINTTPEPDDGDGISAEIDTLPEEYSDGFSDEDLDPAGTTSGTITNRGDQMLTITDEPNPSGVRIAADPSGGATKASVSVCGGLVSLLFGPGDEVIVTCGSANIEVIVGPIEGLIDGEISIVVSTGAKATVTKLSEYTIEIENAGLSGTITLEYQGETTELSAGESTMITIQRPGSCTGAAGASTLEESRVYGTSYLGRHLGYLLLPLAATIGLRIWRRKR
jgi:hypothetical protein